MESKSCSTCKQVLPMDRFSKDKSTRDGKSYSCKSCNVGKCREYYTANREKLREYGRKRYHSDPKWKEQSRINRRNKYKTDPDARKRRLASCRLSKFGITDDEFNRLFVSQGNKCAICRCSEPPNKKSWSVDHDHISGKIRGILCSFCNTGIGLLRDDDQICLSAHEYLRRHKDEAIVSNDQVRSSNNETQMVHNGGGKETGAVVDANIAS